MKKTQLFLVLTAIVLTGAWSFLQNPITDSSAQIAATARPRFTPIGMAQNSISAPGTNIGLSATILFDGTFYADNQVFASTSAITGVVFRNGVVFRDYNPEDLVIKLGYENEGTTTTVGISQTHKATFSLKDQTIDGSPLPEGDYSIGIQSIQWVYTYQGNIVTTSFKTENAPGWRTPKLTFERAAKLTLLSSTSTAHTSDITASSGLNGNEANQVALLTFNATPKGDGISVKNLTVHISYSGNGSATASTLYLYDGTTNIGAATVTGTVATFAFQNFFIFSPRVLTVKADIRNANAIPRSVLLNINNTDILSYRFLPSPLPFNTKIPVYGNIASNPISFTNTGIISLASTPSIDITITKDQSGVATGGRLVATFNVNIKPVSSDVTFGYPRDAFEFSLLRNGTPLPPLLAANTVTSIYYGSTSATGTTLYMEGPSGSFHIGKGYGATIPVIFDLGTYGSTSTATNLAPANYSVRITKVNYGINTPIGFSSDFTGNPLWSTPGKARP